MARACRAQRRRPTSGRARPRRRSPAQGDARHSPPDRPRSRGRSAHRSRRLSGSDAARRDSLAQMGDEEDARPGGPERRRGFGDAGPVGVGLDDGGAFGPARHGAPARASCRPSAPRSIVSRPGALTGATLSFGRSVPGSRICMSACIRPSQGRKASAPSSPRRRRAAWTKFNPLFRLDSRRPPRFRRGRWRRAPRRGTSRGTASQRGGRFDDHELDPQGGVAGRRRWDAGGARLSAIRRARRRLNRNPWPVVVRRSRAPARLPAFHLRQPERADRRPVVAADHRNERQPELRHFRHAQYLFVEGQRRGRHVGHLRHADDRQRRRTRFGLRPARPIGAGLAPTSSTTASGCVPRRASPTARK